MRQFSSLYFRHPAFWPGGNEIFSIRYRQKTARDSRVYIELPSVYFSGAEIASKSKRLYEDDRVLCS